MSGDNRMKMVAKSPGLVLRLFFAYLSFKRKAKKAAKSFRKELIRSGIEKKTAKMLADEFAASSNIFNITNLRGFI
jgi:hypothetical protein